MGLVELVALVLFVGEEEVSDHLHVDWLQRLTGALESPVVKDFLGHRHVGSDWRSSRMLSRASWMVGLCLVQILLVQTCHSMKPVDLRKWGEDVEFPMQVMH